VFSAEFHSFHGTSGSAPCGCDAPASASTHNSGRIAWSIVTEVPPLPLVTVVIPVFNRERTVVAAIESVLRQTYQSIEVIVVDDASTDGSIDAVRSVSDPRVRLVEAGTNRGAAGARNLGIAMATGEFVAFQDSDDEWLPTKLQRQMDLFESRTVAVYCGMAIVEPLASGRIDLRYNPPINLPNPSGDLLDLLLEDSIVSTQTLVVRREMLDVVGGFDESLPATEDWDLAIRLAKLGPIIFVDDLLVVQRFSENSLTRNTATRLSAEQQILEKHFDEYQLRPRLLARHYYGIAGGHRQFGNLRRAAEFLRKARQADRSFYRVWLGYLLLASHRLHWRR
jgi:glycosyltransferase involved in cell wall biosynthesis